MKRQLLLVGLLILTGCQKHKHVADADTGPGGGANPPPIGLPSGGPEQSMMPAPPAGGGQPAAAASGAGPGSVGVLNRVNRDKCLLQLRQVYLAYTLCITSNGSPPRDSNDLKAQMEGGDKLLKSPRDGQPFKIAFNVDPAKLSTPTEDTLLAWEATADSDGNRCVLAANGVGYYFSEAEFQKKIRPKAE